MAKTTNNNARQTHVSPGIYTKEVDLTYAAKSLGITTLGVVGETVKGPAFQPILVDSWRTYQNYFGGTSTEKFRGSQYPKYELPYIAKSYLEESQQLQVCRVLGLSGVNAGAAWLLTAASNESGKQYTDDNPLVIGVLRSRGEHRKAAFVKAMDESAGICEDVYEYDKIVYFAKDVKMTQSADLVLGNSCKPGFDQNKKEFTMDVLNYGTFTLVVTTNEDEEKKYSVTLNPSDKNYILNVLGTDPSKGDSEIYVEELYDVAIQQLIERDEIDHIAVAKEVAIINNKEYTVVDGKVTIDGTVYTIVNGKVTIGGVEYPVVDGKVTIDYTVKNNKITINDKEYTVEDGKVTIGGVEYLVVDGKVTIDYVVVGDKVTIGGTEYTVKNGKVTIVGLQYPAENYYRLVSYKDIKIVPSHKPVYDLLVEDESMLTRRYVGRRYLYSTEFSVNEKNNSPLKVHVSTDKGKSWTAAEGIVGHIYTVVPFTKADGSREYYYGEYVSDKITDGEDTTFIYSIVQLDDKKTDKTFYPSVEKNFETEWLKTEHKLTEGTQVFEDAVEVLSDNLTYIATVDESKTVVKPVTLDFNNYKEAYRYASTPWIVSEMKGSAENVELTKLFRFHTISDGSASNTEVKVSLANIDPENGTFDVLVRSFYDTDSAPVVLERYTQCNLIPGSSNYIAYKIGSTNEDYETRSNYITVEVNETDKTKLSVPAGFLGYPVRCFDGAMVNIGDEKQPNVQSPYFQYNTNVDEEIRINKQYFGISDLTGIDEDILRYKGVEAYNELPEGLSPCFHLDSRILERGEKSEKLQQTVTVDGIVYDNWVTVGKSNVTDYGIEPRLGNEDTMFGTIYEDKRYRKFTVAFYGGWDGWDYFRDQRSNDDSFTYNKYRGSLNRISGEGVSFSVIRDPEAYGFDNKAITSDYYAYLYGIRQFANPKSIDINVFATPGIDYVNNKSLVGEAIEMIETERADSVYVITTPDKPSGAGDGVAEMYTPYDAVANLEDSEIDSNYACTYYPWVKYFDQDNSQYIYLPVTKDIVRNFAMTDNTTYPWFAAAGWNRGSIYGVKSKRNLKLAEQDALYDGRINFINSFPDEGMKLWGDKNLQERESQMNRISKRRLLVHIRKLLAVACVGLLFDPNDNSTVKTFKSAVEPILQDIVKKRGLTDFRIEIDDSQEARDRLELPAKIYLKLLPSLEYITIDFTISPSGVSFDNI